MTSHRILVVDDDVPFARALAEALRRRGHTPFIAHDRTSALAEARAFRPTRAVLDLRLGAEHGLELLASLRTERPDLAVVVLTGYGSIPSAVEAMRLGAVNYLTKPASAEAILAAFNRTAAGTAAEVTPSLEEVERLHIQRVLHETGGNVSEAARRLRMHRRTLQRKLARMGSGSSSKVEGTR